MIFCLLGPSGAGKGTFANIIRKYMPKAISSTTRAMREGEVNEKDYYFVENTEETMKEMKRSPAYDNQHRGVCYWTKEDEFLKSDNVFCEMSKKGIEDLKKYFGKDRVIAIYIYAKPEECFERILNRDGANYAHMRNHHNYREKSFENIGIADYAIINTNENNFEKNKEIFVHIIKQNMD